MKTDHAILITGSRKEKEEKEAALQRLSAQSYDYGFRCGREDLKKELRNLIGATSMDDVTDGLSGHD